MRNKFLGTGSSGFHPWRKLRTVLSGLRFAIVADWSVAWKVLVSVGFLVVSFWLRQWVDFVLLLVATGQMLMAEIFNTTVEALCDFVQPNYDEKIKAIKDIAAAAAGISITVWCLAVVYESFHLLVP